MDEARLLKIKATLDALDAIGIDYKITGSLGMKVLGIIDRLPNDLDLVVNPGHREKITALPEQDSRREASATHTDIALGHKYYPKDVNGLNVCFFERYCTRTVRMEFMGKEYEFVDPAYSIEAKLVILKNRLFISNYNKNKALQHCDDIKRYWEWVIKVGNDNPFDPEDITKGLF